MGSLEEVYLAAKRAGDNVRTVGFATSPCTIPEVGKPNFELKEGEMAMGMGIHGEPGIWNGPIKSADAVAEESLKALLDDMPLQAGDEVSLLVNGLGATSIEELYILAGSILERLEKRKIAFIALL